MNPLLDPVPDPVGTVHSSAAKSPAEEYVTSESESQSLGDEDTADLEGVSEEEDGDGMSIPETVPEEEDMVFDKKSVRSNKSDKNEKAAPVPWVGKDNRAPEKGFQLQEVLSDGDDEEVVLDETDEVEVDESYVG